MSEPVCETGRGPYKLWTMPEFAKIVVANRLATGRHGNLVGVPDHITQSMLGAVDCRIGLLPIPAAGHMSSDFVYRVIQGLSAYEGSTFAQPSQLVTGGYKAKPVADGLASVLDAVVYSGLCKAPSNVFVVDSGVAYYITQPGLVSIAFSKVYDFARDAVLTAFQASQSVLESTEGSREYYKGDSAYSPKRYADLTKILEAPVLDNAYLSLAALLDGLSSGRFKITEDTGIPRDQYNSLTLVPSRGYRVDASDFLLAAGACVRSYTASVDDGLTYWYEDTKRYDIVDSTTNTDAIDLVLSDSYLVSWIKERFPSSVAGIRFESTNPVDFEDVNKLIDASLDVFLLSVASHYITSFAPNVAQMLQNHDNALRMGGRGLLGG